MIDFELNRPEQEIVEVICQQFKNCNVSGKELVVVQKPTSFDPFAGRGILSFTFSTPGDKKTWVRAEVKPTSLSKEEAYLIITFFALVFLISIPFTPLLTASGFAVGGLTILATLVHVAQKRNSDKLRGQVLEIQERLKN